MSKRKVIVWGGDDYNMLGILRQLVPYRIDTFVVFSYPFISCAKYSKYCKHYAEFQTHELALDFLLNWGSHENEKAILLTHTDAIAEIIDLNRERLSRKFILTGTSEQGLLSKIQNKNEMVRLAKECGFNVPKSMPLFHNTDISKVNFPCFIKPALNFSSPSLPKQRCDNAEVLQSMVDCLNNEDELIVQEYIDKKEELCLVGVRLLNGEVEIPGILVRDRMRSGSWGSTAHGKITKDIPPYVDLKSVKALLRKIDYYGPFGVEYGIDNETAYFYEINLRVDGTSDLFRQAGANVVYEWVVNCFDIQVPTGHFCLSKEVFIMDEFADYENVKRGLISKSEWKKQKKEVSAYIYYDKHDIMPYLVMNWKQLNVKRLPQRVYNKIMKLLKIK